MWKKQYLFALLAFMLIITLTPRNILAYSDEDNSDLIGDVQGEKTEPEVEGKEDSKTPVEDTQDEKKPIEEAETPPAQDKETIPSSSDSINEIETRFVKVEIEIPANYTLYLDNGLYAFVDSSSYQGSDISAPTSFEEGSYDENTRILVNQNTAIYSTAETSVGQIIVNSNNERASLKLLRNTKIKVNEHNVNNYGISVPQIVIGEYTDILGESQTSIQSFGLDTGIKATNFEAYGASIYSEGGMYGLYNLGTNDEPYGRFNSTGKTTLTAIANNEGGIGFYANEITMEGGSLAALAPKGLAGVQADSINISLWYHPQYETPQEKTKVNFSGFQKGAIINNLMVEHVDMSVNSIKDTALETVSLSFLGSDINVETKEGPYGIKASYNILGSLLTIFDLNTGQVKSVAASSLNVTINDGVGIYASRVGTGLNIKLEATDVEVVVNEGIGIVSLNLYSGSNLSVVVEKGVALFLGSFIYDEIDKNLTDTPITLNLVSKGGSSNLNLNDYFPGVIEVDTEIQAAGIVGRNEISFRNKTREMNVHIEVADTVIDSFGIVMKTSDEYGNSLMRISQSGPQMNLSVKGRTGLVLDRVEITSVADRESMLNLDVETVILGLSVEETIYIDNQLDGYEEMESIKIKVNSSEGKGFVINSSLWSETYLNNLKLIVDSMDDAFTISNSATIDLEDTSFNLKSSEGIGMALTNDDSDLTSELLIKGKTNISSVGKDTGILFENINLNLGDKVNASIIKAVGGMWGLKINNKAELEINIYENARIESTVTDNPANELDLRLEIILVHQGGKLIERFEKANTKNVDETPDFVYGKGALSLDYIFTAIVKETETTVDLNNEANGVSVEGVHGLGVLSSVLSTQEGGVHEIHLLANLGTQKYTVTYDGNQNDAGEIPADSKEYLENDWLTLGSNQPTREGYNFVGWLYDDILYQSGERLQVKTESIVFVAQWEKILVYYTVQYLGNEHTGGTVPVDTHEYLEGDWLTLAEDEPTREGYTFAGWLHSDVLYQGGDSLEVKAEPIEFVAQWKKNLVYYTVQYSGNNHTGGSVPVDTHEYLENEIVKVSNDVPTKEGYDFKGWLYDGVIYQGNNDLRVKTDNVLLVAQWEKPIESEQGYRVYYRENGLDLFVDNTLYSGGEKVLITSEVPVKTGFLFVAWNYMGTLYQGGDFIEISDKNLDLRPQWRKIEDPIQEQFTLKYHGNHASSGTVPSSNQYFHRGDTVVIPTASLMKVGYHFGGWTDGEKVYQSGDVLTFKNSDILLTAVWIADAPALPNTGVSSNNTLPYALIAMGLVLMLHRVKQLKNEEV